MAKQVILTAVIAAGITAAAFVLNPSPQQHRDKIKAVIAERSPLEGALGIGALTAFTSNYHSLGVASYTTVDDRTVSVGAFGVVYVRQRSPQK